MKLNALFTKNGIITFDSILQLQKEIDASIQDLGSRAANAKKIVDCLYKRPMINAEKVSEVACISMPSAYKLISIIHTAMQKVMLAGQENQIYS